MFSFSRALLMFVLAVWLVACFGRLPVSAAPRFETPMDIIAAVNAFRASQGLAPYTVDQNLMAYAQSHAEYEASIGASSHTHSDGSTAWSIGLEENIAEGDSGLLTPEYAVYTIWQDPIHLKPMIGFVNGSAGAGVATVGGKTYYTFNVRPAGAPVTQGNRANIDPNVTATPVPPIVPLVTATPRSDGTIWHEVGYGQTLWSIANAYGVNVDSLCGLNSMEAGCTQIYAGVRLLIRWKGPTPSPAPTSDEPEAAGAFDSDRGFPVTPTDNGFAAIALAVPSSPTPSPIVPLALTGTPVSPLGEAGPGSLELLAAGLLIAAGGVLLAIVVLGRSRSI
jgi:hypothetical protein